MPWSRKPHVSCRKLMNRGLWKSIWKPYLPSCEPAAMDGTVQECLAAAAEAHAPGKWVPHTQRRRPRRPDSRPGSPGRHAVHSEHRRYQSRYRRRHGRRRHRERLPGPGHGHRGTAATGESDLTRSARLVRVSRRHTALSLNIQTVRFK